MESTTKKCNACGKSSFKFCGKCNKAFYCSVNCQKIDWPTHKQQCNKAPLTIASKITQKKPSMEEFEKLIMQQSSVPPVHTEYQQIYSNDIQGYKLLEDMKIDFDFINFQKKMLNDLPYKDNPQNWLRRFGSLDESFLQYLSQLFYGDIIKNRIYGDYGNDGSTIARFQGFKNAPLSVLVYQLGKVYVGIGFVDLSTILFSSFHEDPNGKPLEFYGYDMNHICIARSLIIYEMLKLQCAPTSIFQVWFCSSLSEQAFLDLQTVFESLEKQQYAENIQELIELWSKTQISTKVAQEKWFETVKIASLIPALSFITKEDRMDYVRYSLTGRFLEQFIDYKYGNQTMVVIPELLNYKKDYDSIYHLISTYTELNYEGTLAMSIFNSFKDKIYNLSSYINTNKVICLFKQAKFSLEDPKILKEIKNLDPYQIDWSNIPDYMSRENFLELAEKCSSTNTVHTVHFMNWIQNVFGTSLLDYDNMQECYDELVRPIAKALSFYSILQPYIRKDPFKHPLGETEWCLGFKYYMKFVEYYFEEKCINHGPPKYEQWNLLQRSDVHFFISFSFNNDICMVDI